MSQINPDDKSAHQSDLGLTFLPPIFVSVTLPAAPGSHLILVALVFYSQLDDISQDEQINPFYKSAHRSDLGLTILPPIFVLVTLPAALGSRLVLVALVYYSEADVKFVED